MSTDYKVSDYLLDRLAQIGIRHFFGVPGDYNLFFLDHVIQHPEIEWVGCANELNAAYAADGYARCKPAAALLTTFGVGELSAINGIAGSYAEYLPVIHIVGAPSLRSQQHRELLHHTLGDGDFGHFARMAREITAAQAYLTPDNAESEIDRLLSIALFERRPVYLMLPSDVADAPASRPAPLPARQAELSSPSLQAFIAAAQRQLASAQRVSLLADFLAERFGAQQALTAWMEQVKIPHATLLQGKGLLNEHHPLFTGTYIGAGSDPLVREVIEGADVVINVGVRFTDTITAGFSHHLPLDKCIDIQPFEARVGQEVYHQIPMLEAIKALHQLSLSLAERWQTPEIIHPVLPAAGAELDQHAFWQQIQQFLRPNDVLIVDQGTACFGAAALHLPPGCDFIAQTIWGSIGYTLPAAYGAQLAEPQRRVILLVGDGAAQLTIQELGSMLRDGLKPVIFLLNNQGYTVERAIHGPQQRYNDIALWRWTLLPQALGGKAEQAVCVSEKEQLAQVLAGLEHQQQLMLIEVILPKMDVPELLGFITRSIQARNSAS